MPYEIDRLASTTERLPKLEVGDAFRLLPGMKVAMDIPRNRYFANRPDDTTLCRVVQTIDYRNDLHTAVLSTEFVVYQTTYDGGGSDHGHEGAYPDGHHVWAESLDDPSLKIDFYHGPSSCANQIPLANLQPGRKMKRAWIPL